MKLNYITGFLLFLTMTSCTVGQWRTPWEGGEGAVAPNILEDSNLLF